MLTSSQRVLIFLRLTFRTFHDRKKPANGVRPTALSEFSQRLIDIVYTTVIWNGLYLESNAKAATRDDPPRRF